MTLDDAIKHCQQVAKESDCSECANEHKQLAQWLQELKEFKKMQTNEEWFCTLPTEEKAKWMFRLTYKCYWCGREYDKTKKYNEKECPFHKCLDDSKGFVKWLKQPHTNE